MSTITVPYALASPAELEREIARFMEAASKRSEVDLHYYRRRQRRHHCSWPLAILDPCDPEQCEHNAALHNATTLGIAFLSRQPFECGQQLLIRLFWHDEGATRTPAVVRHCTPTDHGYLTGCEFVQQLTLNVAAGPQRLPKSRPPRLPRHP